jgi:hypothetical protein
MSTKAKLGINAAVAGIGLLLTLSHPHHVVALGYFVAALSLVLLLYLQLTLKTRNYPNMSAQQSHRLQLAYGVLVIGLILQFSAAVLHSSAMSGVGAWIALIGFVAVLCMQVISRVGNDRVPHQPE